MRLFSVRFDDSDVVVVEPGIELHGEAGLRYADLGTDVGGATLAMVPLRIPVLDLDEASLESGRLREASVGIGDEGKLWFSPERDEDGAAFVALAVIQRSPDARTEVAPFGDGVECVGNAFDRPMDIQLLVLQRGAHVQFRRFSRGGATGPWETIRWDGERLVAERAQESAG